MNNEDNRAKGKRINRGHVDNIKRSKTDTHTHTYTPTEGTRCRIFHTGRRTYTYEPRQIEIIFMNWFIEKGRRAERKENTYAVVMRRVSECSVSEYIMLATDVLWAYSLSLSYPHIRVLIRTYNLSPFHEYITHSNFLSVSFRRTQHVAFWRFIFQFVFCVLSFIERTDIYTYLCPYT